MRRKFIFTPRTLLDLFFAYIEIGKNECKPFIDLGAIFTLAQ